METMMTLGELRAATRGMDDDLCLDFALDLLGETVHCSARSARRVDDPGLGLDGVVLELLADPDAVAGDAGLMEKLDERRDRIEDYYESIGG